MAENRISLKNTYLGDIIEKGNKTLKPNREYKLKHEDRIILSHPPGPYIGDPGFEQGVRAKDIADIKVWKKSGHHSAPNGEFMDKRIKKFGVKKTG